MTKVNALMKDKDGVYIPHNADPEIVHQMMNDSNTVKTKSDIEELFIQNVQKAINQWLVCPQKTYVGKYGVWTEETLKGMMI